MHNQMSPHLDNLHCLPHYKQIHMVTYRMGSTLSSLGYKHGVGLGEHLLSSVERRSASTASLVIVVVFGSGGCPSVR